MNINMFDGKYTFFSYIIFAYNFIKKKYLLQNFI